MIPPAAFASRDLASVTGAPPPSGTLLTAATDLVHRAPAPGLCTDVSGTEKGHDAFPIREAATNALEAIVHHQEARRAASRSQARLGIDVSAASGATRRIETAPPAAPVK